MISPNAGICLRTVLSSSRKRAISSAVSGSLFVAKSAFFRSLDLSMTRRTSGWSSQKDFCSEGQMMVHSVSGRAKIKERRRGTVIMALSKALGVERSILRGLFVFAVISATLGMGSPRGRITSCFHRLWSQNPSRGDCLPNMERELLMRAVVSAVSLLLRGNSSGVLNSTSQNPLRNVLTLTVISVAPVRRCKRAGRLVVLVSFL